MRIILTLSFAFLSLSTYAQDQKVWIFDTIFKHFQSDTFDVYLKNRSKQQGSYTLFFDSSKTKFAGTITFMDDGNIQRTDLFYPEGKRKRETFERWTEEKDKSGKYLIFRETEYYSNGRLESFVTFFENYIYYQSFNPDGSLNMDQFISEVEAESNSGNRNGYYKRTIHYNDNKLSHMSIDRDKLGKYGGRGAQKSWSWDKKESKVTLNKN